MRAAKKTPPCSVELFPNRHNSTAKSAANQRGASRWDRRRTFFRKLFSRQGSNCELSHTPFWCVQERRYNAWRTSLVQEMAQWSLEQTPKENARNAPCAKRAACRPGNRSRSNGPCCTKAPCHVSIRVRGTFVYLDSSRGLCASRGKNSRICR